MAELNSNEKRKRHPEIYILLLFGFKPKEIINMGYSKVTVYKYNTELPEVLKNLRYSVQKKQNILAFFKNIFK